MTTPAAPAPATPPIATPAPAAATAGPITLEDVRAALGGTDPNATNAGKIRKILGRGSFETIQKHLELIRRQQAPALPGPLAAPPPPPKDAIEAVWLAAWSASQAATYGRTERLSAERDAALELSGTRASDIAGLTADLDVLLEQVTIAQQHAADLAAKAQADLEAAAQAAAETTAALERVTQEKAKAEADAAQAAEQAAADAAKALEQMAAAKTKVEADAAHANELATLKAQVAKSAMQDTIDSLTDQTVELKSQVADLKSLLRSTVAPAAPAANQKS